MATTIQPPQDHLSGKAIPQEPLDPVDPSNPTAETVADDPSDITAKLQAYLRSGRYRQPGDLDDYNNDFSAYVGLGRVETADMRHQRERLQSPEEAPQADASSPKKEEDTGPASPSSSSSSSEARSGNRVDGDHDARGRPLFAGRHLILWPGLCQHRHARREGCRECIAACPEGALQTGDPVPVVDPSTCSGCAACVAACPSGAMGWADEPSGTSILQHLETVLASRTADDPPPRVLFYAEGSEALPDKAHDHPSSATIPIQVASIGLLGPDTLLSTMALGVENILVQPDRRSPRCLDESIRQARMMLRVLGCDAQRIALHDPERTAPDPPATASSAAFPLPGRPSRYSTEDSKPARMHRAAEHLARQNGCAGAILPLPAGAPVGAIRIDASRCTLCMACAGACKLNALLAAPGVTPGLRFVEDHCIQCGLCAASCPENALALDPRLRTDPDTAMAENLHRADAALCTGCGKPFASTQMISAIERRLAGHWMYADEMTRKRLRMCDQCRVRDRLSTPEK